MIYNQIVTWTAFAILAMFIPYLDLLPGMAIMRIAVANTHLQNKVKQVMVLKRTQEEKRKKRDKQFLKEELTPPFVAAVKSTRECGESGREATATLASTQIQIHAQIYTINT